MNNTISKWELNPNAISNPLKVIWLASAVALILGVKSINSFDPRVAHIVWIIFIPLYFLINLFFTAKYIKNKKNYRVIFIESGLIFVPSFIFGKKVKIDEIKSLEKYSSASRELGVLVGRSNKGPIFIEKKLFISEKEFDDFFRIVSELTSRSEKNLEEIDFLATRQRETSHLPLAVISLALTIIYLFTSAQGWEKIDDRLLLVGGLTKEAIHSGQFYRIASSFFLHLSPWHLGINILCFSIIGRHVLVILGVRRFFNIFFISGIFGALASMVFSNYDEVVGASGGVLGLLGAYTCMWQKHHKELPGSLFITARMLFLVLVWQTIFDALEPGIDMSSHIAGFIFGFLYARWVLKRSDIITASKPAGIEKFISIIVALVFICGLQKFFNLC